MTYWTKEHLAYLRDNYGKKTLREIADVVGRSKDAVRKRAQLVSPVAIRASSWSAECEGVLRELYGQVDVAEIAERLGRSETAIYRYAQKLGLKSDRHRGLSEAYRLSREAVPPKPKGWPPETTAWAVRNRHHPDARLILAMLERPDGVAVGARR